MSAAPLAFVAGLVSVASPCVLPLIPGYLSAVSAVEAGRFGERGVARRVLVASVPFVLGFTLVFVVLGVAASLVGRVVEGDRQTEIAGVLLVAIGLAFAGLIPWPDRLVAPGLVDGARRSGSGWLLGAAFATCAAPCIGPVLASILVLAGDATTVLRGGALLAIYSLGLAVGFLAAGVAFARTVGAFRWVRDRYHLIRIASGLVLVALGLLLFFHREWWARIAFNRLLETLGLR